MTCLFFEMVQMSGRRILIVDDHKTFLLLLTHALKKLGVGCQVVSASDGFTALAQLKQQSFDLMVTDYNMPGMNGLELAEAARQMVPNIQIILMSVQDLGEVKAEAQHRQITLDGYLSKPFTLVQLQKVINPIRSQNTRY